MFETSAPNSSKQPPAGVAGAALQTGRLPRELEHEFAEMQAAAVAPSPVGGLLLSGLLFHVLLIAEQVALRLPARVYLERGSPLTLLLIGLMMAPPAFRQRNKGRAAFSLFLPLAVVALLAGVPFIAAAQLLPLQSGIALLMLLTGSLLKLPRHWVVAMLLAGFAADVSCVFSGPSMHAAGSAVVLPMLVESLWAPLFGAALPIILAWVRHNEARRDFLLVRQAAFAGVPGCAATATDRHLDVQTGIANRLAFDMRFRAAWEHAAVRRHSVALLFFSIDYLPEQKRDLGLKFGELLQGQVAACLKDSLRRADDMVARFDNQHFVVMLPGVGTDGATQIAERLRGCVEELGIFAGQTRHRVTVTVGAASLRAKRGTPRERLIEGALQALDQARSTGINLVCVEGRGCIPAMS